MDADRLKKTLYRNDLLNQMDDNKVRKVERYHLNRLEAELEDERIKRERGYYSPNHGYSYWDRRDYLRDNGERLS